MLRVTADLFSGRPNPSWVVMGDEVKAALRSLSQAPGAVAALESGFQGLGNRGLIVELLSDHLETDFGVPTIFRLAGGGSQNESQARDVAERLITAMTSPDAGSHSALASTSQLEGTELQVPLDTNLQRLILDTLPGATGSVATQEPAEEPATEEVRVPPPILRCAYEAGAFNPGFWNTPSHITKNNCYNYATNRRTDTFAQPGRASGHMYAHINCADVTNGALSDGGSTKCAPPAQAPRWYMALVIAPGPGFVDYHWYRKSKEGFWGHKPGGTAARNVDNSGHVITDPRTANRGPYTIFCGFMYAQKKMVVK